MPEFIGKQWFRDMISPYLTIIKEGNPMQETPIHTISPLGSAYRVDSRASESNGIVTGAIQGYHRYTFTGLANEINVLGARTADTLTLVNANGTLAGNTFTKTDTSNAWNSGAYGTKMFNADEEDFAVSMSVESTTGTIREMFGISRNNTSSSYTSLDFATYQVNTYLNRAVYVLGASINAGGSNIVHEVGGRQGLEVKRGIVKFFTINAAGTVIQYLDTPIPHRAVGSYFMKCSASRGQGESGAAVVSDMSYHSEYTPTTQSVSITGHCQATVTEEHIAQLKSIFGIVVDTNSLYCDLVMGRTLTNRSDDGTGSDVHPVDITHSYFNSGNQMITNLVF